MAEVVPETSPHTDAEWCIFFILPNLNPPVPSPFVSDYLCLCSATDPRLSMVADSPADNTARRMLAQYRNWFQNRTRQDACWFAMTRRGGPYRLDS